MKITRLVKQALPLLLIAAGCTLYNEVSITPLYVLPTNIERGADVAGMVRRSDYLRAIEMTKSIEARDKNAMNDLASLGSAELAAGRYDDARRHLRAAVDLKPFRNVYSQVAWDLSQVEYMTNNYESSLDWARISAAHGMNIKQWHLDYLQSLANTQVYEFPGKTASRVLMRLGKPDVPRIEVRLNDQRAVSAVVDSGAVLSILSQRYADLLPVKLLGDFRGTFYGLLGEPIEVKFGILDQLEIGDMVIRNVPVAIMPDDKMRFLVTDQSEFRIDFLLGANLLKEFRTELDFYKQQITFTRLTAKDRVAAVDQNLFVENFRPVVRGTVNRHGWFLFVLDTGSEVTFLNETQLGLLPLQIAAPKAHAAKLQGLGGSMKHGAKVENVEIGCDKWAGVFRNLPMYGSDERDRAVGIVGENFLKNFRVVLDYGRMRLDLIREN